MRNKHIGRSWADLDESEQDMIRTLIKYIIIDTAEYKMTDISKIFKIKLSSLAAVKANITRTWWLA